MYAVEWTDPAALAALHETKGMQICPLYTLHHTPYTLHPTTYTLHPLPYTLHPHRTPYAATLVAHPGMW